MHRIHQLAKADKIRQKLVLLELVQLRQLLLLDPVHSGLRHGGHKALQVLELGGVLLAADVPLAPDVGDRARRIVAFRVAERDGGQRAVPRAIVALQRDDSRMGDEAVPLDGARVVGSEDELGDEGEPEDSARGAVNEIILGSR